MNKNDDILLSENNIAEEKLEPIKEENNNIVEIINIEEQSKVEEESKVEEKSKVEEESKVEEKSNVEEELPLSSKENIEENTISSDNIILNEKKMIKKKLGFFNSLLRKLFCYK